MQTISEQDRRLIEAMQDGLPLEPNPYAVIGRRIGMDEAEVLRRIAALQACGVIKRFGIIVRHRELGYLANAMVVWNVADEQAALLGRRLAKFDFVTLCYRRARRLPDWPYNLYCMIHGRDRKVVMQQLASIIDRCGLRGVPYRILFSRRRFKQCGARYLSRATELERPPVTARRAVGR